MTFPWTSLEIKQPGLQSHSVSQHFY